MKSSILAIAKTLTREDIAAHFSVTDSPSAEFLKELKSLRVANRYKSPKEPIYELFFNGTEQKGGALRDLYDDIYDDVNIADVLFSHYRVPFVGTDHVVTWDIIRDRVGGLCRSMDEKYFQPLDYIKVHGAALSSFKQKTISEAAPVHACAVISTQYVWKTLGRFLEESHHWGMNRHTLDGRETHQSGVKRFIEFIYSEIPDEKIHTTLNSKATGDEFEIKCLDILIQGGFRGNIVGGAGDMGADIMLYGDDYKIAVQCKNLAKPVGVRAIQEVHAARGHFKCDYAIVVALCGFTDAANELGLSLGVKLFNPGELASLKAENW